MKWTNVANLFNVDYKISQIVSRCVYVEVCGKKWFQHTHPVYPISPYLVYERYTRSMHSG